MSGDQTTATTTTRTSDQVTHAEPPAARGGRVVEKVSEREPVTARRTSWRGRARTGGTSRRGRAAVRAVDAHPHRPGTRRPERYHRRLRRSRGRRRPARPDPRRVRRPPVQLVAPRRRRRPCPTDVAHGADRRARRRVGPGPAVTVLRPGPPRRTGRRVARPVGREGGAPARGRAGARRPATGSTSTSLRGGRWPRCASRRGGRGRRRPRPTPARGRGRPRGPAARPTPQDVLWTGDARRRRAGRSGPRRARGRSRSRAGPTRRHRRGRRAGRCRRSSPATRRWTQAELLAEAAALGDRPARWASTAPTSTRSPPCWRWPRARRDAARDGGARSAPTATPPTATGSGPGGPDPRAALLPASRSPAGELLRRHGVEVVGAGGDRADQAVDLRQELLGEEPWR